MSDTFNPGPGWVERPGMNYAPEGVETIAWSDGKTVRRFVREAPAAPLPTEPGYYVAPPPSYGDTVVVELLHSPAGQWVDAGDRQYLTPEDVRELGPLVRLEPRAVTARAVLDRVRDTSLIQFAVAANPANAAEYDAIAREFGVTD